MPVPASSLTYAEIVVSGMCAAQGSNPKPTVNIFHYQRNNTVKPLNKSDVMNAFKTEVGGVFLAAINVRWSASYISVRWIEDPQDQATPFAWVAAGQVTGDSMPLQNAAFLSFRTALRGKSFRGSKHIGPMSESDTTAGSADIFNAGALANLNALATACAATFNDADGNTWQPAVVSRKLSTWTATPCIVVGSLVASVLVNKRVGSLLRRKVKSVY